jgi:glycosyltransferase involved in cell wall biosynthesis
VHTDSEFVAAEVRDTFGVEPERVRAVLPGVPRLGPDPSGGKIVDTPPLALPDGTTRYVLAIGTVEPRKDYPTLVEAFGSVSRAHPDVALVIVGADGWGAEQLADAIRTSPARDRIVRPGYLDDAGLEATLRRASVLAFPSVYEGFGFPPLQAMAAGVPVVATAVGAIPEVVGDGALLVDGGQPGELAEALTHVLDGGPDIDALIARGHHRTAAFTWTKCAEGLDRLYRDAWAARASVGGRR